MCSSWAAACWPLVSTISKMYRDESDIPVIITKMCLVHYMIPLAIKEFVVPLCQSVVIIEQLQGLIR